MSNKVVVFITFIIAIVALGVGVFNSWVLNQGRSPIVVRNYETKSEKVATDSATITKVAPSDEPASKSAKGDR